jgi:iron complex transport system substrate-binding protein
VSQYPDLNTQRKALPYGRITLQPAATHVEARIPVQPQNPSCHGPIQIHFQLTRREFEELSAIVVDCGFKLHVEAGPALLESVYEVVLAKMLTGQGLNVKRQVPVPIRLMGMTFEEGFRADLIVEGSLLIELKSVEKLQPVHSKQVLTYLRLLNLPLGLLINFGAPTFKDGCKRIVNGPQSFVSSRLRVNQNPDRNA